MKLQCDSYVTAYNLRLETLILDWSCTMQMTPFHLREFWFWLQIEIWLIIESYPYIVHRHHHRLNWNCSYIAGNLQQINPWEIIESIEDSFCQSIAIQSNFADFNISLR